MGEIRVFSSCDWSFRRSLGGGGGGVSMGVGVVAVLRLAVHGRRNVGGSGDPVSHSARRNDRDNIVVVV